MKNENQRRKYSNIKPFNDCCSTALHEATDKFLGEEGAVIRCGGEIDLIKADPKELAAEMTRSHQKRQRKYWSALLQKKKKADHAPTPGLENG